MQQVIFLAMALVFARDFEDGYFRELVKTGKSSVYLIVLKATPFVLLLPVMWFIMSRLFVFFNVQADIFNLPMLVLVILLSLASIGVGMLFSVAIPNQLKATELLMVISTPAFVLSGFTWPSLAIPPFINGIAQSIPVTHFLSAFRKVAYYGGSIADILPEIKMLLIIIAITFTTMALLLQIKINRTRRRLMA